MLYCHLQFISGIIGTRSSSSAQTRQCAGNMWYGRPASSVESQLRDKIICCSEISSWCLSHSILLTERQNSFIKWKLGRGLSVCNSYDLLRLILFWKITWTVDTKNPLMKNKYAYRLDEMNKFITHLEAYFSSFPSSTFLPQILGTSGPSFEKKAEERMPLYSRNFSPDLLPAMPTFSKELSPTSAPFRPSSSLADMPSIGSQSSHSESRGRLLIFS